MNGIANLRSGQRRLPQTGGQRSIYATTERRFQISGVHIGSETFKYNQNYLGRRIVEPRLNHTLTGIVTDGFMEKHRYDGAIALSIIQTHMNSRAGCERS